MEVKQKRSMKRLKRLKRGADHYQSDDEVAPEDINIANKIDSEAVSKEIENKENDSEEVNEGGKSGNRK